MAERGLPGLYVDVVRLEAPADRLLLINRDPGPDETGVPRGTLIVLEIIDSDAAPVGIDAATVVVYVNGGVAWSAGAAAAGYDGASTAAVQTADTFRLTLDPTSDFSSEQVVSVRVVADAVGGVASLDETYSFTIEDYEAPRLVGAQARSLRVVRLSFDEAVAVTDGTGFTFAASTAPAVPIAAVSADADGTSIDVTVDDDMTPDATYQVTATGVADTSGNPIVAPDDVATFTGFRPPRPAARRFDLWSMLPRMNRRLDGQGSGDLRRFIDCLQDVIDLLLYDVDRFVDVFDIDRAPETFLDLVLADLGNPFDFELDEAGKRRLASVLVDIYRQKGTGAGIENAVRFFLGLDVDVTPLVRHGLILGESELGVDWILGTSERRALYSFTVDSPVVLTDAQREQIEAIAEYMKPAHTHLVAITEPEDPDDTDHWELGVSTLGVTSDLH